MCETEAEESESRNVTLLGELEEEQAAEALEAIIRLSLEDIVEPIHLHLVACRGGDAAAGMALVDVIQAGYTAPVHTYAWGTAQSSAALILAAGAVRKRGVSATVMLHPSCLGMERPSPEGILVAGTFYHAQDQAMWKWLDQVTKQEDGYWHRRVKLDGEVWLDAALAVEYGMADRIIAPKS